MSKILEKISLPTAHIIYLFISILLTLYIWFLYYQIIFAFGDFLLKEKFFSFFTSLKFFGDNITTVYNILKEGYKTNQTLFLNLVIGLFIRIFFNKTPLPSKYIKGWEERGDITPILGRKLALHFRTNYYIKTNEFFNFYVRSKTEKFFITEHSKNEDVSPILTKYDQFLAQDKSYIDSISNTVNNNPSFIQKTVHVLKEIRYLIETHKDK